VDDDEERRKSSTNFFKGKYIEEYMFPSMKTENGKEGPTEN